MSTSGILSGLSFRQISWVRQKAQWEHMSLAAVLHEWTVPSDKDLLAGKYGDPALFQDGT